MADIIEGCGSLSITIGTISNTTPIVVSTVVPMPASVQSNQWVNIIGNVLVNGQWQINVTGASTFELVGSTASGVQNGGTVSRLHSTPVNFKLAHQNETFTDNYICECYDDGPFRISAFGVQMVFDDNNVATAANHRSIRAFAGHEYNPITNTGVRLFVDTREPFAVGVGKGIELRESFFELQGVGIIMVNDLDASIPSTNGNRYAAVYVSGVGQKLFGVTAKFAVGSGDSIACFWFDAGATWQMDNCIGIGSGVDGIGATIGARFSHHDIQLRNSNFYGFLNGSDKVGVRFEQQSASTVCRNVISTDSGTQDFDLAANLVVEGCISSDGSLDETVHTASFANVDPSLIYSNPAYDDFRLRFGSIGIDTGQSPAPTNDITGLPRLTNSPPEIGAYDGFFDPGVAGIPTEIQTTITNRAELIQWSDDTELHFVGNNIKHVGLVAAQITLNAAEELVIKGGVADKSRNRELRSADGFSYNPKTQAGALIQGDAAAVIRIQESFFKLANTIGVRQTNATGSNDRSAIVVQANQCVQIDGVYAANEVGSVHSDRDCIRVEFGDGHRIFNCIVRGGSNNAGAHSGIRLMAAVTGTWVFHCDGHRMRHDTGAAAFRDEAPASSGNRIEACMAALSDFCFIAPNQAFNVSSDVTASGNQSDINISAGTQFRDAGGDDYRLEVGSPGIDSAPDLGVLTDFEGKQRFSPHERGAYQGFVFVEMYASVGVNTHHRSRCYSLIRPVDGFAIFVTDHDSPVPFRGNIYSPRGGFNRSASEEVIGTNVAQVEFAGPITDDVITIADMLSGFWDGAVLTEYDVDNKYPYKAPFDIRSWIVEGFTFDGEAFQAILVSRTDRFDEDVLGLNSRGCRQPLFSNDPTKSWFCRLDRPTWAQFDIAIDTVINNRLSIIADAGMQQQTDDYYPLGEVVWKRGLNAGHVSEVKTYDAATRTISLQLKTPFPIAASDTFDVTPGCDGTWDRCGFFNNRANFKGDRFPPGTDRSIRNRKG